MSISEKFSARLAQACDDCPSVPEYGKGRQVVIADKLGVSQEAVRKWFSNDSIPRPNKMRELAEFLDVDQAWLALGIRPEMDKNAKKLAGRVAEGAVLVIAGSIQLMGGNCAFPAENDPRRSYVDIYAFVRGVKTDIHVSTARETAPGEYELVVPRQYNDVRCIGYFPTKSALFTIVDLLPSLIDKHKVRRAGDYLLNITRDEGGYVSGEDEWPKLKPQSWLV